MAYGTSAAPCDAKKAHTESSPAASCRYMAARVAIARDTARLVDTMPGRMEREAASARRRAALCGLLSSEFFHPCSIISPRGHASKIVTRRVELQVGGRKNRLKLSLVQYRSCWRQVLAHLAPSSTRRGAPPARAAAYRRCAGDARLDGIALRRVQPHLVPVNIGAAGCLRPDDRQL